MKSQNWDAGCRSSDSVSSTSLVLLLPMAGILRTSPSKTAFDIFYAGPAKGCRGGKNCKGLALADRGGGTGRDEGLALGTCHEV